MDRYLRRLMGGNFGRVVTVLVVVFAVTAAAVGHKLTEGDINSTTSDQLQAILAATSDGPGVDAAQLEKDVKKFIEKPKPPAHVISKFRVNIVNGLLHQLIPESFEQTKMQAWQFDPVPPAPALGKFSAKAFYPAFIPEEETAGVAEVQYRLEGTEQTFNITASNCQEWGSPCIKVQWNVDHTTISVYPLDLVGIYKDGTFDIVLIPRLTESTEELAVVPWMQRTKDTLGSLTLTEVTFPGTHNSGSIDAVHSNGMFSVCQSQSIDGQLSHGVRYFDIRISKRGHDGQWTFVHGSSWMLLSLDNFLQSLVTYSRANPYEIFLLDFHSLETKPPGHAAIQPWDEMMSIVKNALNDLYLSYSEAGGVAGTATLDSSLSEIWTNLTGRVVVSCKFCPEKAEWGIWPNIDHQWFKDTTNNDELTNGLTDFYGISYTGEPHPEGAQSQTGFSTRFFNTCLFHNGILAPIQRAKDVSYVIDTLFHGAGVWAFQTNAASADFVPEEINLIDSSIIATMIKGHRKLNSLDLLEAVSFDGIAEHPDDDTDGITSFAPTLKSSLLASFILPLTLFLSS